MYHKIQKHQKQIHQSKRSQLIQKENSRLHGLYQDVNKPKLKKLKKKKEEKNFLILGNNIIVQVT